ncbi:hypothetical protein RHSIM_Rhsim03G0234000 [Rhododendron simsii]|uniref:Uncharacterized protein n=1 Tax=Rhododendron simsii TaxID=118357 RepID=A0A834H481_RHOSS|nr:hypothetical protein RHSIM_Rhsim03G0234000 [Rhododendron simsii]
MAKGREEGEGCVHWDGVIEGMPLIAKELIAGGVAGGVAKTVVAPLERVKILFQTRRAEFQSIGLLGSCKKIVRTEGLLGFYRRYRRWIIQTFPDIGRGPVLDLVAGSFAGGTAVLFTYPLDLVRTKLAYQVVGSPKLNVKGLVHSEQVYRGIVDCFFKTYKEAGIRGLYRGVAPSLYGIFPYAGLKFYFYEEMKSHVPQEHKNDLVVQRLLSSNSGDLKGTMESLVKIVHSQGWRQLFSGLSINYLKVVPSVAIGFTVYDVMKSFLRVPSRDEATVEVVTNKRNTQPSSLHS